MPGITNEPRFHLLLSGRRDGHYKKVIGSTLVLDDDFTRDVLTKKTWHRTKSGYAATNVRRLDGNRRIMLLHRFIFEHYHGPIPAGHEIDHRDRNKGNNLPCNLRAVPRSINVANRGLTKRNRSGYVGVSWDKQRRLWVANIRKEGRKKYLGAFTDPVEAARAVNRAYSQDFPEVLIPNPNAEPTSHTATASGC